MPRQLKEKTLYKEDTHEFKIQAYQKLGGHLFCDSKDHHQVFIWYAGSLGHFGLRVSNSIKVTAPTIDQAIEDMGAALIAEANKQTGNEYESVLEALSFFEKNGAEQKKTLKLIDKKKKEIEELFSKLESIGVNPKMK